MLTEMLMSDFNKESLEERTQLAMIYYFWKGTLKLDVPSLADINPYFEAWANAEKSKYIKVVGGTPKPKPGEDYKLTKKGLDFIYHAKKERIHKIIDFLLS